MDTPKRQVSSLERFPPDIWACIVPYIPGDQLGRLMMTGATLLWRRLKFPGVLKSITLGTDFLAWEPRFLNELPSLEEFSMDFTNRVRRSEPDVVLSLIPSGVRKLQLIHFKRFIVPGETSGALNISKQLPHLVILDSTWSFVQSYGMPQSLTTLKLDRWHGGELPSCLLHFEVCRIDVSPRSSVSKLPPSLESFVVRYRLLGFERVIPLLPASIRRLSFTTAEYAYSSGPSARQNLLELFPKSLIHLEIGESFAVDFETTPESVFLLPSTLTELSVIHHFLPSSAWSHLPPDLTALSMSLEGSLAYKRASNTIGDTNEAAHHEVPSLPFDALPRSITELVLFCGVRFCGPPPPRSNSSFFPPQLTDLYIGNLQLPPETVQHLPSSLTYLELRHLCERLCQHLSENLVTLKSYSTLMSPNLIKFLPKSLTSIHLSVAASKDSWFDYNTGKTIDSISKLPEYSIHNKFDWADSCPLPPRLTYFNLRNAHELGDSFLSHQQLSNLIELNLKDSENLTDLSVPLLPTHITSINLSSSSKVSGKSFEFLPKCLTYLNLCKAESIFDDDIKLLPRTLKKVCLRHAIHLTDSCIPSFPPHLEWLDLELNTKITPTSLPNFPYPFRSFQIHPEANFADWYISRGKAHQRRQSLEPRKPIQNSGCKLL